MTRRDLQTDCKKQSRPWSIGKGFDYSAPMGEITPASDELTATVTTKELWLKVNGETKQKTTNNSMISSVPEVIHHISQAWELQPGDLIMCGTPEGVGAVKVGDTIPQ